MEVKINRFESLEGLKKLQTEEAKPKEILETLNEALALIKAADNGLNEIQNRLEKMKLLAIEGANPSEDFPGYEVIDQEFQALNAEIDEIVEKTQFKGQKLLNGTIEKFEVLFGEYGVSEANKQAIIKEARRSIEEMMTYGMIDPEMAWSLLCAID